MRRMLASVLLDLARSKIRPHKGSCRLAVLRAKGESGEAERSLETLASLRTPPRTLALELKAELIHDRRARHRRAS
jgi:hypothetical protein